MESSINFIQNRTIFLTINPGSSIATADINIPFAVDKIVFRSLAYDSNVTEYAVLTTDLIQWNAVGIVYRDSSFSNSTAQTIEYHFQTPTKIQGRYSFKFQNLDKTEINPVGIEFCAFIAEFIRSKDKLHT